MSGIEIRVFSSANTESGRRNSSARSLADCVRVQAVLAEIHFPQPWFVVLCHEGSWVVRGSLKVVGCRTDSAGTDRQWWGGLETAGTCRLQWPQVISARVREKKERSERLEMRKILRKEGVRLF